MKRLALVLAVVLFGAACTDATAPAKPSLSVPTPTDLDLKGNLPPPPADAAIDVTVYSDPLHGTFSGAYFANGASVEATAAAIQLGDESLAFLGTAWLRIDNQQPLGFSTSASANARFQVTDQKLFGTGFLVIDGHTIRIVEVTSFLANPGCTADPDALAPCAVIEFSATIDDIPGPHFGTARAFNVAACDFVAAIILEGEIIPGYYDCPTEIIE
jgi:hypothetical protein